MTESEHVSTTPSTDGRSTVYDNASLSELFTRLSNDVSLLFRQEVQLAKTELRSEAKAVGEASGMLVAAAVLGFVTLMLLAWAAAWGLAEVMPAGFAFLIVGVIFGAVAAALGAMGKKRMQRIDLRPEATMETLQKDKQVVSERMSR